MLSPPALLSLALLQGPSTSPLDAAPGPAVAPTPAGDPPAPPTPPVPESITRLRARIVAVGHSTTMPEISCVTVYGPLPLATNPRRFRNPPSAPTHPVMPSGTGREKLPLMSATATKYGFVPTAKSDFAASVPSPFPRSRLTVTPVEFAARTSGTPSPVTSATATEWGLLFTG